MRSSLKRLGTGAGFGFLAEVAAGADALVLGDRGLQVSCKDVAASSLSEHCAATMVVTGDSLKRQLLQCYSNGTCEVEVCGSAGVCFLQQIVVLEMRR